ncbi:hypothetical protein [Stenotrophomonas maltophilia]|uniref:hypothetical protein n=1 Tax=Stenotrophomonas maltophilia TaxID=40324 RepID=UPI000AA1B0AB|nr:hypothetical protein [Stenotrophomonas maltophilia]
MAKGIVRYTTGDDGELMRVMPSGQVSFSDSLTDAMRDMYELDRAGYQVLIDGEPLIPSTGFIARLHRLVDWLLEALKRGRHD